MISASLEPSVAQYAFDSGNLSFAGAWLAVASLAISVGCLVISTGVFARWSGWWAILCGIGLVASRFVWTSDAWLLPYLFFCIWVVAISIQMILRPARLDATARPSHGGGTSSVRRQPGLRSEVVR